MPDEAQTWWAPPSTHKTSTSYYPLLESRWLDRPTTFSGRPSMRRGVTDACTHPPIMNFICAPRSRIFSKNRNSVPFTRLCAEGLNMALREKKFYNPPFWIFRSTNFCRSRYQALCRCPASDPQVNFFGFWGAPKPPTIFQRKITVVHTLAMHQVHWR